MAVSAAEIKVRVVDPQSAVVAGAQVTLFAAGSSTPLAVQYSSAGGRGFLRDAGSGPAGCRCWRLALLHNPSMYHPE